MSAEVFHRDSLIRDDSDAVLIENERWDPEEQFDIEVVRDRRKKGGKYQYLLEFTGYPDHKDWSWTDEGQLFDENGVMYPLLRDYLRSIGGKTKQVRISIKATIRAARSNTGKRFKWCNRGFTGRFCANGRRAELTGGNRRRYGKHSASSGSSSRGTAKEEG